MINKSDAEVKLKVTTDSNASEKGMKNLNEEAKKTPGHLDKIKSVGATVFKGLAVGVGAASTALGGLVMKSVSMAGELEQQLGGSEAVFEKFADTVQKKGTEAFKKMGLSQNDYLATANKMGSLMQGAGLTVEKSMSLSTDAMQRAADVASVMGIDVNAAMESIAGAAKGNFTMMDNLGVAMNDTTLNAYALSKGINKTTSEMTNAEKVELAMQMFLEKTSKYAGNYAKENETFAGSFTTLKASISNFLSGAGSIEDVIDSLMSFSKILVNSIEKMAPKIVEGLIGLVNGIIPELPPLLQKLLPVIIKGAIDLINGLVQALPALLPVLMNGIVQAFTGIVKILPQLLQALIKASIMIVQALAKEMPTLIPLIVDAILQMIPVLIDNLPLFIQAGYQLLIGIMQGLIQALPTLLAYLPTIIKSIMNYWKSLPRMWLEIGVNAVKGLWNGIKSVVNWLLNNVNGIPNNVKTKIRNGLSGIENIGKNLIQGLWNGIANAKQWLLNKISGIGKAVMNKVKSIFGVHSPSTEFYWIGEMDMLGLEKGFEDNEKELNKTIEDTIGLDFLKNGSVNVSNMYGNLTPNISNNQPIYVNVEADMDVDKFGRAFINDIKVFSGGTKNSFNYGGGK